MTRCNFPPQGFVPAVPSVPVPGAELVLPVPPTRKLPFPGAKMPPIGYLPATIRPPVFGLPVAPVPPKRKLPFPGAKMPASGFEVKPPGGPMPPTVDLILPDFPKRVCPLDPKP